MHRFALCSLRMTKDLYSTLQTVDLPAIWHHLSAYELIYTVLCVATLVGSSAAP